MASIKIYFDTRNRKDTGSLSVIVRHQNSMFSLPLNITLKPDQWDSVKEEVNRKHPQYRQYNLHIRNMYSRVEAVLLKLTEEGALKGLSCRMLKRVMADRLESRATEESVTIEEFGRDYIASLATPRTQETYKETLKKISVFSKGKELYFEDITLLWLEEFDRWMQKDGLSVNGRSYYMRTLRALFNRAIDKDVIGQDVYPFRKFKIKREATPKRSLTVEQLRQLRDYPCEEWQERWRDMFMLIFYLIGINTVDLMNLKKLQNGRAEYRRAKTHRLYSIKVEPEAQAILDKYKGKKFLLCFADMSKDYRNFGKQLNSAIRKIGPVEWVENATGRAKNKKKRDPLFPQITTYWARHTWATIAASLDIPKETIAVALGHGGNTVTDIYIDFDQKKVDKANRKVIDFVSGKKKKVRRKKKAIQKDGQSVTPSSPSERT